MTLQALKVLTKDTTDLEYTSVATTVTAVGDTVLYTPAPGMRVRLYWIYAINDPASSTSTKMTIRIGPQTFYVAWAISKRQQFTGQVDEPLVINLSVVGNVAVTAFVEDVL